jgi:CubicO group peptidase (beta-lactamase class C family)
MNLTQSFIGLLCACILPVLAIAQEAETARPATSDAAFSSAAPEAVGLSKAALEALDAVVRGYVERDETVGAELMLIKNRKIVWNTAHGWADRDKKVRLEPGSIYCIRSMTKTFVGTAIQMLIDEGKLKLDDRAARFLPAFDSDTHREITVQQLLEHRSGLSLSSLIKTDFKNLHGVQDVAALAVKSELEFKPGSDFNYSDDGTDTLTAIIEKVCGTSAEEFIAQRILKPLAMANTIPVVRPGDARRGKLLPAYAGSTGSWTKFWSPEEAALFPYFLGSQAMYSTCADYARLLCFWADGGMVGGKRLLSKEAIARGLTPRSSMGSAMALPELDAQYGQLWQVWTRGAESKEVEAFGHGGSDGTMAWMWPKRDLIVLYFTQSRGGMSIISFGREIDRILFRGELEDKPTAPAGDLALLSGVYWNDAKKRYWAFWPAADGKKMRAEIQGRTVFDVVPSSQPSTWQAELNPSVRATFEGDAGAPPRAILVNAGREEARLTRIDANADLPTLDTVIERVRAAHRVDQISKVVRREGVLELAGKSMQFVTYLASGAARTELDASGVKTIVLCKGARVWTKRGDAAVEELTGEMAAQTLFEQAYVNFSDWRKFGATATVLRREELDGKPHLLVRVAPKSGLPQALWIDEASGRVVQADRIANIPGIGALGVLVRYDDFAEIDGAMLPRKSSGDYVAVLGKSETRIEKVEVVEPSAGLFEPELK